MTIELPLEGAQPQLEIMLLNTALTVAPSADGKGHARFVAAAGQSSDPPDGRFTVREAAAENDGPRAVRLEEQRTETPEPGVLEVRAPQGTQLRIRSRNGSVTVGELQGRLKVRTRNGAVHVRRYRGRVQAAAANGSLELEEVEAAHLEAATSNGRIRLAASRVGGGSIRSANGRIALQLSPLGAPAGGAAEDADPDGEEAASTTAAAADAAADGPGRLAVYSANGGVTLALPEQINATVKVRTMGSMRSTIAGARSRSEGGVSTLRFGGQPPELLILINNLKGGVQVMPYTEFDTRRRDDEDEFFRHDPRQHGVWFDIDFSEEFPRFMRDMKQFGMKFGRLGEEVSREMRRAFRFGGPGRHEHHRHGGERWHEAGAEKARAAEAGDGERQQADTSAEVKTVLNLLQEGKLSVEEAERLIAALRR